MKAKIRDIGFSPDKIVVGVDCYFEEGEAGYDECWVDVPDYPATEEEPNPPTHKELRPFRSLSLALPVDAKRKDLEEEITDKMQGFKRAHSKVANAQQWVGWEYQF